MDKQIPSHSKRQINKAGDILRSSGTLLTPSVASALDLLGDWRSSHAYPLQCVYMKLRERAKRVDTKALVSQRLKRVPSIVLKLQRNDNMALTTIQDIGGCRAIVADVKTVRKLSHRLGTVVKDYIATPKADGYRGLHLVDQYEPTTEKHKKHAGRKIEIQLRTKAQHAWATAVETVDSLLQQNIKTGGGKPEWRRFFALASCLIALQENSPTIPGCPCEGVKLTKELRKIVISLDVFNKLSGLSASIHSLYTAQSKMWKAYVLILDLETKQIDVTGFLESQIQYVAEDYLEKEKKHFGDPRFQVVQLYVSQLRELRRAYPNYYLDTQEFLHFVSGAIK